MMFGWGGWSWGGGGLLRVFSLTDVRSRASILVQVTIYRNLYENTNPGQTAPTSVIIDANSALAALLNGGTEVHRWQSAHEDYLIAAWLQRLQIPSNVVCGLVIQCHATQHGKDKKQIPKWAAIVGCKALCPLKTIPLPHSQETFLYMSTGYMAPSDCLHIYQQTRNIESILVLC